MPGMHHHLPMLLYSHTDCLHVETKTPTADVMMAGSGMWAIKETIDDEQAKTLPFAVQYMKCPPGSADLCSKNRFRASCWVDRDDVQPGVKQRPSPGGQVKWHPGFRPHQLTGRVIAMIMLTALEDALDTWSEITIAGKLVACSTHASWVDYAEVVRNFVRLSSHVIF